MLQDARPSELKRLRMTGSTLDFPAVGQSRSACRVGLQGALGQAATETREAQDSPSKKNRAIKAFDRLFTGEATSRSVLFTLGGERGAAYKVRPSARRRGQTGEQAE